jgi:protein TonB
MQPTATPVPTPLPAEALRGPGRRAFQPGRRFSPAGITAMIVAHLAIGYLLVSGLARQAVEIVKRPLEATIVQEVKLPEPPPPPPPKIEKLPEPPKLDTPPPPAFVPPPDVPPPPAAAPAPAITAVQSTQPVAPPPAAPTAAAGPMRQDIAVACPKQVAPVIPERALDEGISGKVRAEVRIRSGRVVDVTILSGPKVFHQAVRAALQQYQCVSGAAEIVAVQDFEFKVE